MPPTNIKQQKPYKSVAGSNAGGNAGLKKNTSIPTNNATDETDRLKKHARAVVTQGQADFYHPLFQESTLMLPTKTREIFQYCRHWYRCLTPDTRVLLSDGTTKEIQNIDKNDTVITENGTASNINEIFKKEIEDDIYLINAKGIQKTICATKQHPFLAIPFEEIKCIKHKKDNTVCKKHLAICKNCSKKDVEFKTRYIHAKDLKINDVILTPVMKGEIECVYTDEWLRLLGYYLAEGCIYKKHGRNIGIRFSISKKERKTLGKNINALCNSIYGKDCYFYDVPRGDSLEVRIYVGNHGVDDVIKHAGEYSHYKTLSQEMMLLPPQKQMIILGSYLDGDGSIDKSTKTIIATTVSKKLVSQMQQICIRNGITARIYQYWNNEVQGWKYILRIPAKFGDIISKYSKFNFNKKKKRIEHTFWVNEFIGQKITKTEKEAYKGLIYNLNVEGDYNSFVADGVIVHNTDPMVAAAINFHAEFCINGFRNICKDERVKKYFDEFAFDIVKLPEFLSFVALEWYKLGQVVPFGIWNEGDGRWDRFITLNPDYVEIEKTLFSDKPLLKLDPDEGLKRIVTNKKPRHLYDQLDPNIIAYVNKGQKIPLSSLVIETEKGDVEFPQVTLLARKASQYEVYGTPMLMSVFKVLIYKDLLRNAQFAIAKRHWKPIKLVKVGDKDHEPTAEILDAVEEAIRAADADSNSWLVWHHYISADYIASAGHVMPLQCHDEETQFLSDEGWKYWHEYKDDDKVASYNKDTGLVKLVKPTEFFVNDYEGKMIKWEGQHINYCVTPTHGMLIQKSKYDKNKKQIGWKDWERCEAKDVPTESRGLGFINGVEIPKEEKIDPNLSIFIKDTSIKMDQFVKFIAWYVTEGCCSIKHTNVKRYNVDSVTYRCSISQSKDSKYFEEFSELMESFPIKMHKSDRGGHVEYATSDWYLGNYLHNMCGTHSYNKTFPRWFLGLPKEMLNNFLLDLLKGDGSIGYFAKDKNDKSYTLATISVILRDLVQEVAFRLGYVVHTGKSNGTNYPLYTIMFSETNKRGAYPKFTHSRYKKEIDYKGKIWCFNVEPHHIFITRRGPKNIISISYNSEYSWIDSELMRGLEISDAVLTNQGMTFANASVSLRVMVNKYRRFQKMLSSFIKEFIYKPVAEVQGFYETDSEGNKKLIIPDVEWELDKLQDDAQLKQVLQGLQQKGLISKHTLMAHIGVDNDKEKDMIQSESKDDAVFNTKPAAPGQQMTLPVTGQPPAAVPPIGGGGGGGMPPAPKVPGAPPAGGGVAPPVGGPLPPVSGTQPIGGGGEGTLPPVPGV